MRRASDNVARARAELERCQNNALDGQRPTCLRERKLYEAARRRVRQAEEKVQLVRRWAGRIEQVMSEYKAGVGPLQNKLEGDLPRSLALLERMLVALESYAEFDPAQQIDASGAGSEPEPAVAARDEDMATPSPWKHLRERAPSPAARDALPDASVPFEPPAESVLRQWEDEAAETAAGLGLAASPIDWDAKVVVNLDALDTAEIYAQRIDTQTQGDSGWLVGAIEAPDGRGAERYETVPLGEVAKRCPQLHRALALPPGFLAVIRDEEITAVLDQHDTDVWSDRSRS